MKRREFLQVMMPVAGLPLLYPIWAHSKPGKRFSRSNSFGFPDDGRVLVLVQLSGGNDGLNTIIPYRNDLYYQQRPQLAIPSSAVLDIDGEIGLHSAMAPFQSLYADGNLGIVQGVGYPNPDRSHFRSTDIWLSGSGSDDIEPTGWLGRYFDLACPEGEACGSVGPPAIQIGLAASLALMGREQKGITLQDPVLFYNLVSRLGGGHDDIPAIEPVTPAEKELEFLRDTEVAAFQFAEEIIEAYEKFDNQVSYPGDELSAQLAIVSRLIAGGLSTRIYIVSMGGYDTHAFQADDHAGLLGDLSTAISLFQQELEIFGLADRVAGMCFSEFGRRVGQNASLGTDHGTAAPLFLFGQPINGGIYGTHPSLSDLDDGDLKHGIDYRQIYASVLEQWLIGDSQAILGEQFSTLPLIGTTGIDPLPEVTNEFHLFQNYPNPFNPATTIEYFVPSKTAVQLEVFNALGQRLDILVNQPQDRGRYQVRWNANGHPSGSYFFRLSAGSYQRTRRMTLLK